GHASVAEAMRDEPLAAFVDSMIKHDIMPMLPPVRGLDLDSYRAAVLERFRNPAIVHRLDQIAQDGSQKLPYRLGDTLLANRAAGRLPGHVVAALGCWVAFAMRQARAGTPIVDPAPALAGLAGDGEAGEIVDRLLAAGIGIPRVVADDPALVTAIRTAATAAARGDWQTLFG
ncbi:MAG TPA: mannitol dehydrogenase family protein, partial [Sphingomonas sp.]|nr:mannitol dehydrogenase family protein [Sphingomonas sp.]